MKTNLRHRMVKNQLTEWKLYVYVNICIFCQPPFLLTIKRKCGAMTVSQGQSFSLNAYETDVALRGFRGNCRKRRRDWSGGGVNERQSAGMLLLWKVLECGNLLKLTRSHVFNNEMSERVTFDDEQDCFILNVNSEETWTLEAFRRKYKLFLTLSLHNIISFECVLVGVFADNTTLSFCDHGISVLMLPNINGQNAVKTKSAPFH